MPIETIYSAQIEHLQILDENGQLDSGLAEGTLTDSEVLELYKLMIAYREFDELAFKLQRSGRMGTFPQNKGEEAVSLGAAKALRKGIDHLVPYYRENAAMFLHGLPMHYVLMHWMGDERGNAIPDHLPINPICVAIGGQLLHAVGIAWSFKIRKEDRVVLTFMGDGATSTGDFHEALNIASVMKVPCVFVCVNNGYAISVPTQKQTASETFAQKALAYGMPTIRIDGNDLFAAYKATRDAIARAREGQGPSFIEAVTYRLADHTTADDARRYRCAEEVDAACARDPLVRTRKYLESRELWDETKESDAFDRARTLAHEVAELALNVEKPQPQDMFTCTFEQLPPELQRQMQSLRTDSIGQEKQASGLTSAHESAEPDYSHSS